MKIVIDTGQDGTIINARVRQKAATEAEWLSKDPEILDGEAAFVRRADGAPVNFKLGDGNKKFSELPYFVTGDAGEFINVMGSELPVSGPNFPDKGYAVVGPGTYTQSGGPDVVVPSGHMGILNWDGSVWYLGSSVELPDNSAKIAEWEAGTYEKDEVVTVDGIIYRASEQTNEEPPSVKWEAIGGSGSGSGVELDVDGGALSYDTFLDNSHVRVNPTLITIESDRWIAGETVNSGSGATQAASNISRLGKTKLKAGYTLKVLLTSVSSTLGIYVYELDGSYIGTGVSTPQGGGEVSYTATEDCYVDTFSVNNLGDFHAIIEAPTLDGKALLREYAENLLIKSIRIIPDTGASVSSTVWDVSEFIRLSAGDTIQGVTYSDGLTPVLFKYDSSKSYVGFDDINHDADGKCSIDFTADENMYVRVTSLKTESKNFSIQVLYSGGVIMRKTSSYGKEAFIRKGMSYTFNGLDSLNDSFRSTPWLKLSKGDKLTASLYNSSTGSVRNIAKKVASGFTLDMEYNQNIEGEPTLWEYTSGIDMYVGLNTRVDYDDDYWVKIERSDRFEVPLYDVGDTPREYIDGYPYSLGDVVQYRGAMYKAVKLTFDRPYNSSDWEFISGAIKTPATTLEIPSAIPTVNIDGDIPMTPNKAVQSANMDFIVDGRVVFNSLIAINVQGDSSAAHPKKGYNVEFLSDDFDSIDIQFSGADWLGDAVVWPESDSFHWKGFWADELMTRDVSGNRLWRQFIRSRSFSNFWPSMDGIPTDGDRKSSMYEYRSSFITDGFPFIMNVNGEFHSVQMWRQKKHRSNYGFDSKIKSKIWLEALGSSSMTTFNPSEWELRSPKLEGYNEGGVIDDAEIMGDINRLWDWVKDCVDGIADFNSTYHEYIELESFVQYIIFCELLFNFDGIRKNFMLMTYGDGVWKVNAYDLDFTLSYRHNSPPDASITSSPMNTAGGNRLFDLVRNEKLPEIKSMYKKLKDGGVINVHNLFDVYRDIPSRIGPDLLQKNFDKWSSRPYDMNGGHRSSLQFIMTYFKNRIAHLDSIWDND